MMKAMKFITTIAIFLIVNVRAFECEDNVTPTNSPGCMTYWYRSQLLCVTAFGSCAASSKCNKIEWGRNKAVCFDGCATISHLDGYPVCLATEGEIACNVVYNKGVPSCLTDHCGVRVDECSHTGHCLNSGGAYCFDGCISRGINWKNSGPYCDDNTSPCDGGEFQPECMSTAITYAPTGAPTGAPTN